MDTINIKYGLNRKVDALNGISALLRNSSGSMSEDDLQNLGYAMREILEGMYDMIGDLSKEGSE